MVVEENRVLPLILSSSTGEIIDVVLTNQKGYLKSLEQKHLWYLHRDTGRLIPYDGHTGYLRLTMRGDWCEAVLAPENASTTKKTSDPGNDHEHAAGTENITESEDIVHDHSAYPDIKSGFLETLENLILSRRDLLPEGSYTTHLFTSGVGKIRKKLGEEAIELLLAEQNGELVHESADLIYHLLILLAEKDIPLSTVIGELERRHRE